MKYKYNLEKSSKKHHCPKCGKRTFVRYIDNENGEYLSHEFGRCDRENNCGYFATPKGEFKNEYEVIYTPPAPTSYHTFELVEKSGRNFKENNFVQFLKKHFIEDEIQLMILRYFIGTANHWKGATVFWQMDNDSNIRHGKIMLYDSETGKRKKNESGKSYIHSVRSLLKLKDFNLKQCLFGLHLINHLNSQTIGLVESEKTAIIMSLFKPEYIWMATGSKSGFKYEMLKPIKDYSIIAFPDKSEFYDWDNKANELNEFGFKIKVARLLEETDFEKGTDLADVYLSQNKTSTPINPPNEEVEIPIETNKIPTNTETKVIRLIQKNPAVKKLVETFDLTDTNRIPITL